jgi:DNA-binding NtrC family response regulator
MESHPWPGNVRELKNIVERMVIMTDEEILKPHHLPSSVFQEEGEDSSMIQVKGIMPLGQARETLEKKLLGHALAIRRTTREVAQLLGVDHSTVVRKLKKYGLQADNMI